MAMAMPLTMVETTKTVKMAMDGVLNSKMLAKAPL